MSMPSNAEMSPAGEHDLPAAASNWAMFLDFDGTLTEIAPAPHLVDIASDLPQILTDLSRRFGGAVALVSGRPLDQLDELTGVSLAGAGVHGLELRRMPGMASVRLDHAVDLEALLGPLQRLADRHPGCFVERKTGALAVHYRAAPQAREPLKESISALITNLPDVSVIDGKMVFELKPAIANKGAAITALMEEAPFAGRVPVFAGDDTTDEYGFEAVNARQGISIKVGEGDTRALHRVGSVPAFLDWLRLIAGPTS